MNAYSFKDTSLVLSFATGSFTVNGGKVGIGGFTLRNMTERSAMLVGADGGVTISYVAGDNAEMDIETQQSSDLHRFLIQTFNQLKTAADNGDPTTWASGSSTWRSLVDRRSGVIQGLVFTKIPDEPRGAQAQNVTWRFMAGDSQQQAA